METEVVTWVNEKRQITAGVVEVPGKTESIDSLRGKVLVEGEPVYFAMSATKAALERLLYKTQELIGAKM